MEGTRTKNAIRNMIFGFINKAVMLVFPFIIRSVIINTLGVEYLGLNSLFVSILQVLNLAELGFNSAVIYSMYKPIAEKDTDTICALMNMYKKIYRIIGIVVTVLGLCILPFISNFIKGDVPANIDIYILYLIYLANTSLTYFLFAYKNALLTAHQRSDIISNIQTITNILQFALQIVVLVVFKNYYMYAVVQIIFTIINNIYVAIVTNKKYPKYLCKGEVDHLLKKDIKKRVTGLMIQKICATSRNSLDSIFISAFIGLGVLAIYSNYYSIMSSLVGIMAIITSSIVAGIGNSIVVESEEKNYQDMNRFNFIYMWISGWCTVCLLCLYQPFMQLWMGSDKLLPFGMVILFCIYFYSLKMGDIRSAYSDAKGLWYESRYRAIAESIANIILNVVLVHFLGIYGIIIGTLISLLIINFGYGSQILFKYYFIKEKVSDYFLRHLKYAGVTFIICLITYYICSFVNLNGIQELVTKLLICIFVPNIIYILIYGRTKVFKESKEMLNGINIKNKRKNN